MQSDTLKRFDRLVSILIQLQSKKVVKAQEIAERFQVSQRTIYRDIKTLESAGVPVFGEAGIGYSLVDGYRLPPVMFTREEAAGFLAAEKLMRHFSDQSLSRHFESALLKIKSVLRTADKNWLNNLYAFITVHKQSDKFNASVPNALELLMESLGSNMQIALQYCSLKDTVAQERFIEPVGIFHENQYWYILAYCHLRKDYRQFRLDRIYDICVTALPFVQHHSITVEEFKKNKRPEASVKVKIIVDRMIANYLKYDRHYYGFVAEKECGNRTELQFMIPDNDNGFIRWYLMFADYADIIEPIGMKAKIKAILAKSLDRLNPDNALGI